MTQRAAINVKRSHQSEQVWKLISYFTQKGEKVKLKINGKTIAYTSVINNGFTKLHKTPKKEPLYFPRISFLTLVFKNSL